MIRNRLIVLSIVAASVSGGLGAAAAPGLAAVSTETPRHIVIGGPQTKLGDKCAKGTAGCTRGKFTGQFFGN